jgi:hypothetical protein
MTRLTLCRDKEHIPRSPSKKDKSTTPLSSTAISSIVTRRCHLDSERRASLGVPARSAMRLGVPRVPNSYLAHQIPRPQALRSFSHSIWMINRRTSHRGSLRIVRRQHCVSKGPPPEPALSAGMQSLQPFRQTHLVRVRRGYKSGSYGTPTGEKCYVPVVVRSRWVEAFHMEGDGMKEESKSRFLVTHLSCSRSRCAGCPILSAISSAKMGPNPLPQAALVLVSVLSFCLLTKEGGKQATHRPKINLQTLQKNPPENPPANKPP